MNNKNLKKKNEFAPVRLMNSILQEVVFGQNRQRNNRNDYNIRARALSIELYTGIFSYIGTYDTSTAIKHRRV